MAHDASHDSDLSRLRSWRPRRPVDGSAAEPAPSGCTPDAEAISALLGDLADLRLRLSADMGLLASAVELDAHDIAAEVVDGERADLDAFAARSAARLTEPAPGPSLTPRSLRRKLRAAVPTGPALAAAAAVVGILAGLATLPGTDPAEPAPVSAGRYAELQRPDDVRIAVQPADQVDGLHAQVARILALAAEDPVAAEQALRRLAEQVTAKRDDALIADLRDALAHYRDAIAALEATVARTTGVRLPALLETPRPLPLPAPVAPAPGLSREGSAAQPANEPAPGNDGEPSAEQTPAQESSSPSPSSTPEPAPSPGLWPPSGATAGSTSVLPPPDLSGE